MPEGSSSRTDVLPAEPSVSALVAHALRRERARTGLSLTEVARRAGIAKSTLSALESGGGNPSVETLWALGVALDVPFSRLVEPPPREPVRLVRAGEGPVAFAEQAEYAATVLAPSPPRARRDLYRIVAQPGRVRRSDPHMAGSVEHVVLSSGRAVVGPVDEPVELGPGDYLVFPGDQPHRFEALVADTSAVLVMEHT